MCVYNLSFVVFETGKNVCMQIAKKVTESLWNIVVHDPI